MKTRQSLSGCQLLVGYLAAFGSIASSMFSATCVQALQGAFPDFQLSALRGAVQGIAYLILGLIFSSNFHIQKQYIPGLLYASMTYLFYNVGFFAGASYLPLGDLEGVVVISGIAFALAQSKLLFNKDIEKFIIIAAAVCAAGIVLTVQPSWIFTNFVDNATVSGMDTSSTLHPDSNSHSKVLLGYAFGILGGAGQGLMSDANGIILQNVKIIPKATYEMLFCTVGSAALMFYLEDPVYVMDGEQFVLLLGHTLLSATGALAAVYAASVISGPILSVLWSFEVVTMLLSQYTIMHSVKPGNYNWIEVLGCTIVVCGASIPGVIDILAHRAKADELP